MSKLVSENINDYLPGPSEEEILKRLEQSAFNPDKVLSKSVENGLLKGVEKALEEGADIHFLDDYPIKRASELGFKDIVELLHDEGANIHISSEAPLRFAAEDGHLDVVKYLVENGADIHAVKDGALRKASHNGHLDIVKYLVEHGANIHANDDIALRWALLRRHLNIAKYLIKKGADIRTDNDDSYETSEINYKDIKNYIETYLNNKRNLFIIGLIYNDFSILKKYRDTLPNEFNAIPTSELTDYIGIKKAENTPYVLKFPNGFIKYKTLQIFAKNQPLRRQKDLSRPLEKFKFGEKIAQENPTNLGSDFFRYNRGLYRKDENNNYLLTNKGYRELNKAKEKLKAKYPKLNL